MSVLNSWCERICLVSLFLSLSILLADYKFYFLPIHGLWLVLYVFFVIVSTIWFVCVDIHKLLQRNTPYEYEFESSKQYQKLLGVYRFISNKVGAKSISLPVQHVEDEPQTPALEIFSILNVDALPVVPSATQDPEKSIDDRINALVSDIELKFISKWYNLISDDENFPAEAKILLEGVLRRVLQVSVQLDSGKILCGALVILLKHLKEYRRAIKRAAKGGGCVEAVYRYGHMGNKSSTGLAHFTHQLTANVLREFISWELWTSLPCRLLVAILSKRLTSYIIYYISQPGWLNYKMLYTAASSSNKVSLKLDDYQYISLSDVDLSGGAFVAPDMILNEMLDSPASCTPKMSPKREVIALKFEEPDMEDTIGMQSESMIENALVKMIAQQTAPILQRAEKSASEIDTVSLDNDVQAPYKRSEPVKIHSASSTKCWDDTELANLSLGQDLLALEALEGSGIHNFSGRRLWGYSADPEADADKQISWESVESWSKEADDLKYVNGKRKDCRQSSPPSISSIPHCLRPATTSASAFVTNTIRPIALKRCFLAGNMTATTLHNMRELQQSTVNNVVRPVHHVTEKAIHKIGDLQDEAVGVVEGIFDFGMAGIRKGLRLTGLQETDLQKPVKLISSTGQVSDLTVKDSPKAGPKLVKLSHVSSEDTKMVRPPEESCWINPLSKESPNGFENQMLLEKSPNLIEGEAPVAENPLVDITESIFFTDSPEYEETADLASTISKLRSLLQQKSSESSLNTPAVSPMPFEDKSCLTPVELPCVVDGAVRPSENVTHDGGMQRFARTVTGMFNTFKTALPGNINDQSQAKEEQWLFVENESSDADLPSLLNSLLVERRDYCTVDTAYEAMDSLDLLTESISSAKIQWENNSFADELDDLDSSIPMTKALLDVVCECLQDTKCALNQEPVAQALLLLAGMKTEEKLKEFAEKLLRSINRLVGPLPKYTSDDVLALDLDHLGTIIEASLPYYVREIFGHEDLRTALEFFISSLQSVKINQDITLQFFELVCSQLIFTSGQLSPTPSA